jgi:hypothetical protein
MRTLWSLMSASPVCGHLDHGGRGHCPVLDIGHMTGFQEEDQPLCTYLQP